VFDIWKPGPARWAESNFEGGAGVMLDDVVAGIFAGALMTVLIGVLAG
jgi:phosphatidylglycerophosphatase A